ncbi:MAG TPA: discoidin domain-containing protein [Polyangiaceae bacterium]|jgi:hypothetical protein
MRTLDSVTEALLLRDAERRALSYGDDGDRVRALAAAAAARVAATKRLTAPAMDPVVASLLRDAIALRLRAAEAAHTDVPPLPERVRATLDDRDGFDGADAGELRESIDALKRAEREVRVVESRTPENIRATRFGRVAAVAIAVAWAIWGIGRSISSPPNVAFHKTVIVDGLTAPGFEALVDGETDTLKPVVLHASDVTIDLAGPYAIRSVRLYNRQDRSFDSSLPLDLETSIDGTTWTTHVRRRDHFSIWNENLGGTVARYVRLRSETHVIALNEIEVFGRFAR